MNDLARWGVAILLASLVAGVLACSEDTVVGDDGSPSNIVFPTDSIRYSAHVQSLFNQACALPGCHDQGSPPQRVRLTSYGETVILVPGIVVPGQPDQSELVLRIEGRLGDRMPIGKNPLNQNQIQGIRKWILEGARNN